MNKDDTLWKGILENICDDFLKFFFEDAEKLFDLERGFQFLDKELEQLFPTNEIESPKFVDKLVKVYTKTGEEDWILVHIEVQGYDDKDFAKRMFTYFYRILDKYGKPVTAIAIFTDTNKKFHPGVYEYKYLGSKIIYEFNTYKIIEQDETELIENENPFAIIVLTVLLALKKKKLDDESLFDLKYSLAKNLLRRKISKKKIDDLLIFLQRYITFADQGYNAKFDKEIGELTGNQKSMGIREMVLDKAEKKGIEKGVEKATVAFIISLWETGNHNVSQIASLLKVSEEFVQNTIASK
ncbi:conserved hypothetical protein (putative transposase or invertase) [Dyadobacter koreensis]|uniref:Transposase (putative) YhgA-like domain-containing protein n=1 Tax=Dyadobacter koreensis TaxID=408657 RepID=A0A1H6WU81_9BACT|nr:hypothetical protein [Dyadobacter koreensis]SEJ20491.1 conserved hypothetical protein (putative transposase or invertase) [Dyadobacter koreensis]